MDPSSISNINMGETIQESAEEAVDKVADKLTSTFKDLTSAAEEKAAEVEEDAAEAEAAIAEAKARTEEDIENEVRNMVEDLEQELPPPDMTPPDSERAPAESQHSQEPNEASDGGPHLNDFAVTGVIITELVMDEPPPPDTTEVNLGFVEIPADTELLGTPRDTLEREIVGSPPPSALSRPTSALQGNLLENNFQPQVVPFPFANLTEVASNHDTIINEQTEEQKTEPEKETADDTSAESPTYEENINAEPTESKNDNASISELNNNELTKDEITDAVEDASQENNNETIDHENLSSPLENPVEETAINDDQKDENDNDKEKEEDDDDGTEKDVENR